MGIKIEHYFLSAGSIWVSTRIRREGLTNRVIWCMGKHSKLENPKRTKSLPTNFTKAEGISQKPQCYASKHLNGGFWLWVQIMLHFRNLTEMYSDWSLFWGFVSPDKNIPILWILPSSLCLSASAFQYFRWCLISPGEHWPILGPWSQHPRSDIKLQKNLEQIVFCRSSKQNVYWLSWRKSQVQLVPN